MKPFITTIAVDLDARRNLLLYLRTINPSFFSKLYERLQDKLTYTDLTKAFMEELALHDIVIVVDELTIYLEYKTAGGVPIFDKHDDYESALQFALALLRHR